MKVKHSRLTSVARLAWLWDRGRLVVLSGVVLALGRAADRVVGRVATLQHPQEAPDGEDGPPVAVKDALVQRVPQRLPVVDDFYRSGRRFGRAELLAERALLQLPVLHDDGGRGGRRRVRRRGMCRGGGAGRTANAAATGHRVRGRHGRRMGTTSGRLRFGQVQLHGPLGQFGVRRGRRGQQRPPGGGQR